LRENKYQLGALEVTRKQQRGGMSARQLTEGGKPQHGVAQFTEARSPIPPNAITYQDNEVFEGLKGIS
jgi:hypothetical protein